MVIGQIADLLNKLEGFRSQMALGNKGEEKCPECTGKIEAKISEVERHVWSMRMHEAVAKSKMLGKFQPRGGGRECERCLGMTRVHLNEISQAASALENDIVKGVFKIVGEKYE